MINLVLALSRVRSKFCCLRNARWFFSGYPGFRLPHMKYQLDMGKIFFKRPLLSAHHPLLPDAHTIFRRIQPLFPCGPCSQTQARQIKIKAIGVDYCGGIIFTPRFTHTVNPLYIESRWYLRLQETYVVNIC